MGGVRGSRGAAVPGALTTVANALSWSVALLGVLLLCVAVFASVLMRETGPVPVRGRPTVSVAALERAGAWHDGDIILSQRSWTARYPASNHTVVHAGIVWVHPEFGPCIMDRNDGAGNGVMLDARTGQPIDMFTRLVRVAEFVRHYDGVVLRRPVVRGRIAPAAMAEAVEWVMPQMWDGRNINLTLAFIPSLSYDLAVWLSQRVAPPPCNADGVRIPGMTCSEMTLAVLQRVGALDPALQAHVCLPHVLCSRLGLVNAAGAPQGFAWGVEERLVP